jgi:hypothetical protein
MTLIRRALRTNDIDAALKPLQDALGITEGDVAGVFFSRDTLTQWTVGDLYARAALLAQYLRLECLDGAVTNDPPAASQPSN